MATTEGLMTADELLRLPRGRERHELIAGKLRTMPLYGFEHGVLTGTLSMYLYEHVRAHGLGAVLGATGFQLATNPDTVRAPDVAFVRKVRVDAAGLGDGYWPGAPDLAGEVISPDALATEVAGKILSWLEHGTSMVLVLHARRRTAAIHRPNRPVRLLIEDDTIDGEDVLPGWMLPVRALFE